ncbi:hypothetical protein DFP73DRAFT_570514 [Morchella snyderi]|nr:hypothetical protein DFP73DRAFT_570514 [Morchella snyderi]
MKHRLLAFFLFVFPLFQPIAADDDYLFCTYPISGSYGYIPRILLYILLWVGTVFFNTDWLVGATFGTAMFYSSVTSVHLVVIASTNYFGYWDPDSVPSFNVLSASLLAACLLLKWSPSFREAMKATRITVFAWIVIMATGLTAGIRYDSTPLGKVDGDEDCRNELPLRIGQDAVAMYLVFENVFFWRLTDGFVFSKYLLPPNICLSVCCGLLRKSPFKIIEGYRKQWQLRWYLWALLVSLVYVIEFGFAVLVTLQIAYQEYNMSRPDGWLQSEDFRAIGQWGQFANTAFTFGAAAVGGWYRQRERKRVQEEAKLH